MAWIEKRQRQHRIAWRVGYRDPGGKVRVRTFGTRDAAQAFAHEVEHDKNTGDYAPDAGKLTLAEQFDSMMATAVLRATTRAKYETLGRLYIVGGPLGDRELRSITKRDVREYLAAIEPVRPGVTGTATREAVARLLHRVLQVAVDDGQIRSNPAHGVKVEAARRRQPRFLTEAEVGAIVAGVEGRYRTLVWTLAIAGLRIGEASALRVGNVDTPNATIRVVESSAEVAGVKVTTSTKTDRDRTVDIPPRLARMLAEHISTYSNRFDETSLVFTGPDGGAIRQNGWRRRVFQPAAEAAGITPLPTVHDLRHTAASFMARAGLNMLEAGAQLGHSSTTMTARYSHVFKEHRQAKMATLDEVLA